MSRFSRSFFLRRKLNQLAAVILCYLLLLTSITPVAVAGGGWVAIEDGRHSVRSLTLLSTSLNRWLFASTATFGRFLLLEVALALVSPDTVSWGHLSLLQRRGGARAPEGTFPVLGEVPQEQVRLHSPEAIPSTLRSRRKPLQPRNGRRVGDPGTTLGAVLPAGTNVSTPTFARREARRPTPSGRSPVSPQNTVGVTETEKSASRRARARNLRSHHLCLSDHRN